MGVVSKIYYYFNILINSFAVKMCSSALNVAHWKLVILHTILH